MSHVLIATGGDLIVSGATSIAGPANRDLWLLSIDDVSGRVQWQKTYGTQSNEFAGSIIATSDGYLLTGGTDYPRESEDRAFLTRVDVRGDTLWTRNYGGGAVGGVQVRGGVVYAEGFVMVGTVFPIGGTASASLLGVSSTGVVLWSEKYLAGGGSGMAVVQSLDGDFGVAAITNSGVPNGADACAFSVKLDQRLEDSLKTTK